MNIIDEIKYKECILFVYKNLTYDFKKIEKLFYKKYFENKYFFVFKSESFKALEMEKEILQLNKNGICIQESNKILYQIICNFSTVSDKKSSLEYQKEYKTLRNLLMNKIETDFIGVEESNLIEKPLLIYDELVDYLSKRIILENIIEINVDKINEVYDEYLKNFKAITAIIKNPHLIDKLNEDRTGKID